MPNACLPVPLSMPQSKESSRLFSVEAVALPNLPQTFRGRERSKRGTLATPYHRRVSIAVERRSWLLLQGSRYKYILVNNIHEYLDIVFGFMNTAMLSIHIQVMVFMTRTAFHEA